MYACMRHQRRPTKSESTSHARGMKRLGLASESEHENPIVGRAGLKRL